MTEPYGGIARRDRVDADDGTGDTGPWCDKAWHLGGEPAPATAVWRCRACGQVYARCAACNRMPSVDECARRHIRAHGARWERTR